ncbi:MAG: ATP-dependent Clp protease proteolytic subunit [Clostridia bacterium]|nr:ATP-dependent Clp protease proteolytic subunit [Clostridia bacterium]
MDEKETSFSEQIDEQDVIEKSGGLTVEGEKTKIHCMSIIGQIEGHYVLPEGQKATKYEHIVPLIVSIEQNSEIDGLLIVLNTMGGDVEAGLAIAELIASMKKPTVSLVLGGGHSIGVPLAVCAKKSFIVPSATMTIHPVRISGTVVGSPQTFYYFEKMQERITKFVCDHSKITSDEFTKLMMRTDQIATDTGSIIDGNEATRYGLINKVGGLSDAMEELYNMINAYNK